MKVLAVIPSRYASTRFPAKSLAKILGKPMVQWVVESAKQSQYITEVIVATDHQDIASAAKESGASAIMTDPDLPSGSDRVWASVKDKDFDWVLNVQGDEPAMSAKTLDTLIEACSKNPSWQMVTAMTCLDPQDLQDKNVVKVIPNHNSEAIYFSRFAIPYSRRTDIQEGLVYKHLGLYAYQKEFLQKFCDTSPTLLELAESLEQLRALYMGAKIGLVYTEFDSCGVDTPDDIAKAERLIRSQNEN